MKTSRPAAAKIDEPPKGPRKSKGKAVAKRKATTKGEVVKKVTEEISWQDLEQLPLDLRRMTAMSFSWETLEKGCSTKALTPICRDPEFWFQKLKMERLILDQPIAKRWIELWLGTPEQDELLVDLENGDSFSTSLVDELIRSEYYSDEFPDAPQESNKTDPLIELARTVNQVKQNLRASIGDVIALESVEINLDTAAEILRKRKRRLREKISKRVACDCLSLNVPEWSHFPLIVDEKIVKSKFSGDKHSEDARQIKTYSDYLNLIKRNGISVSDDLEDFLEGITVINIFEHMEDYAERFSNYMENNVDKEILYQNMAYQKTVMIGLHLKTGDLLTIGSQFEYFVVRNDEKVNLYPIKGRYLPIEALPILLRHQIQTSRDLERIYPDSDLEGIVLNEKTFIFGDDDAKEHIIEGQTFYGHYRKAVKGLSEKEDSGE